MDNNKLLHVLIIEDNPGDVYLISETLKTCVPRPRVTAIEDGNDALDYLKCRGLHANALRPDIILLDMHIPGRDGQELLFEIKKDPRLSPVVVAVMTGTATEREIVKTYNLPADAYVLKPVDAQQFAALCGLKHSLVPK